MKKVGGISIPATSVRSARNAFRSILLSCVEVEALQGAAICMVCAIFTQNVLFSYSIFPISTIPSGLGQVMLPMSTPAVLAEGGVYLMYYMGGTHEETAVSSYLEDPSVVPDDATIKGMNLRVGVAMSQGEFICLVLGDCELQVAS